MKIQELVENTCDIKLKNKSNIIEKFKNDFSEIINNNQINYESKLIIIKATTYNEKTITIKVLNID